ncbi:exonuclease domain-containing protein [Amycolatopsis palatopharyngis]|uniref:3'-5' exonuclease n=1 Tax=Amycolatopsis palatopharyngis TaxID=187982 RepID=UPI000E2855A9|nr:exonuclease domain-containing protein [Amycolatopsis palatopharyngis]
MSRQIVVVDVESTGLDFALHVPVEIAWMNLTTGEWGCFVPHHTDLDLRTAEAKALEVNDYRERLAHLPRDKGQRLGELHEQLLGNTLAGSNPRFDSLMLRVAFTRQWLSPLEPWHHRLLDLSAYAAGVLGIPPSELPGLAAVCALLAVENTAPHTAMGDVEATAECFRRLEAKAVAS